MKPIVRSVLRICAGVAIGVAAILVLFTCLYVRPRAGGVDTAIEQKSLRFYKYEGIWYADVPQHSRPENRMVAGADTLLEDVSGGKDEVYVTISSDVKNPAKWKLHMHIVEHDTYGAAYRVTTPDSPGFRLAWICNVAHTVFGGEHPTDIYIHSIEPR